jgi:hypothetical protein
LKVYAGSGPEEEEWVLEVPEERRCRSLVVWLLFEGLAASAMITAHNTDPRTHLLNCRSKGWNGEL